jgi:hypothetical protein
MFSMAAGVLLSALALAFLASPALAGPGKGSKGRPDKAAKAQLHEGLSILQTTKKMLQSADHDYGGHRMAAVKAIDAAESQLTLAIKSQHKGKAAGGKALNKTAKKGTKGKGKKNQEPQDLSNLQLADAIVRLEQTQALLEKAKNDYGGHRDDAVRDLGGAIQQLKIALTFEKKKKG